MKTPEEHGSAADRVAFAEELHALAQPLTALGFILELGLMQEGPDSLRQVLLDAKTECRRAVAALEALRAGMAAAGDGAA